MSLSFYNMVSTQFQTQVQILRSDRGEYGKTEMKHFFTDQGLVHQNANTGTPQQNGVAKQKNMILLEKARDMMFEVNVPPHFWLEAVATTNYLSNRLPTKALNYKTPFGTLKTLIDTSSTHSLQH